MNRQVTMFAAVVAFTVSAFAGVTIRDTSRSFEFGGGGAIISTDGGGTWTASADVSWLTITTTSGNAGSGVPYLVGANNTADVRVGHITVAGNVYTVTQSGRMVELSPAAIKGGSGKVSGEIALVTDANVTWTVRATEKWITVSPLNGTGPATLTYTIQAFNGVGSRSGSITVGSQTIPVAQTGIDVNLTPVSTNVAYTVTMIPVIVDAMADQTWTVKQNDPWLSIVDAGTGRGGSQVMLCAAENPSYEKRTGTVSIGTGKVTVTQDGTSDLSFKILPEVATASPLGAFGNVAVYATPDATWTAESLADWIHISSGEAGAGNGNVKYVANANLDLKSRTGQIKFTPPAVVPDVDLYRGLLFWIKDQKNIEGNEERKTNLPLNTVLDGSKYIKLMGQSLPDSNLENHPFTLSFSFKVAELNRINRIAMIGKRNLYFNENNCLCYNYSGETRESIFSGIKIDSANTWYTFVIAYGEEKYDDRWYFGERGKELRFVTNPKCGYMYSSLKDMSSFRFGNCDGLTSGNLQSGQFANIRFWTRALTDRECECVDTMQNAAKAGDNKPMGVAEGIGWNYFPLDGNAYSTTHTLGVPAVRRTSVSGCVAENDQYERTCSSLGGSSSSLIRITNFETMFSGSCILNNGVYLGSSSGHYRVHIGSSAVYLPYETTVVEGSEEDATYAFWMKVKALPTSGKVTVFNRSVTNYKNSLVPCSDFNDYIEVFPAANNKALKLELTSAAQLVISGTGMESTTFKNVLECGKWYYVVAVGRSRKLITVYLDGVEIGNVKTPATLGYLPNVDGRHYLANTSMGIYEVGGEVVAPDAVFTLGGWNGCMDGLSFIHGALTTSQVRELYAEQVRKYVYHTVTQGVIEPTLSTYSVNMPKGGGNANVSLTLAKGVNWTAKTSASWLSIAGDTSGAGSAEFTIKVAANPTVKTRTGTVTIAGKTVKVTQEPLACEVICDNPVFGTAGDMGTIVVNPELGGSWTATTDEDWIYIVDGESGTGSGDVWFITEGYDDTTGSRTGVIKIGEEKVYITQRGFELSIDPMVAEVGGNAGAGRIGVSADLNAVWTALAQEDWIEIVTGGEGIGDGTVVYRVKDNKTGQTRTGHIYISGQVYTITQTCTLKLTASVVGNGSVDGAGDYSQGKEVTLRAVPNAGNVFSHWSGDVVGNDDVTTVKMDSVKNVTATFIPEVAAQKLVEQKAAQGGFYTRDQIHALEMGNLVFDVDASGTARVGVQLMETSDLSDPNSWKPATLSGNPDVGQDGTVGMKVKAEGNAKFFKVVMPDKQ